MRHDLSLFLAASFLWMSQALLASSHDDDNAAAPAVAAAPRAPVLNPDDEFSTLPTHVLRQIGDILLENDFQSLGRFLQLSRTTNALKDQIFHTTQTMGTVIIDGKERTVMHYGGANNTKDRVLELLGRQTGNPELFEKDHARDYQNLNKTDLLKLLKNKTLEGALDQNNAAGQAYFELKTQLLDTSVREVDYSNSGLLLCPNLRDATHLESLDLSGNQLKAAPVVIGLTQLEILILKNNKLTVVPDVTGLMKLRWLFLSNNQLTAAPDLTGLMNLSRLTLANNQLTSPPDLTGLTKLEHLTLANNQLTSPPDLTGLTKLERLYLNNNQLTVPPYVTGLTKLKTLYLNSNQITIAPDVTGLMQLESLFLDTNLCGDQNLLKTLRVLNSRKVGFSWCALVSCSKDDLGNTIYTAARKIC